MSRKGIRPGEKVPVPMSTGDRDLMVEYVFGDPDYVERLRPASVGNGHDSFFKRLLRIQGSYDDGNWNDSGI